MDRVIIFKNKEGDMTRFSVGGYTTYKNIKEALLRENITNISNVLKYKLCSHCKDGYLEVNDKKGLQILKD